VLVVSTNLNKQAIQKYKTGEACPPSVPQCLRVRLSPWKGTEAASHGSAVQLAELTSHRIRIHSMQLQVGEKWVSE